MINLYEYQNKHPFTGSFQGLEDLLDNIWHKREKSSFWDSEGFEKNEVQQFIQFLRQTNEIKSNKYVGVIHYEGEKINLFPKIFYRSEGESDNDYLAIQKHILWWLSYCRKIRFPSYHSTLGNIKSDFFEILIYLFAKYTKGLLSNSVYQQYEEIDGLMSFVKGRIDITKYATENLSKGNWNKINCIFDSFIFDNSFNRIIKYVTNLLYNVTSESENRKNLREILFILDEVTYVKVSAEDCHKIQFNPFFEDFETVRDYCYLFLKNWISLDYKNDLKIFAFLLPMEYVFEDFIFGFIEKEIKEINAYSQPRTTYLDNEGTFLLKPDLYLKMGDRNIIADTKYKIVYDNIKDTKNGVSQSDLYQMLAYGIRFKVDEIKLLYPETINNYQDKTNDIKIRDEFANGSEIRITTCQLPIINRQLFENSSSTYFDLLDIFSDTKIKLIERLKEIFRIK